MAAIVWKEDDSGLAAYLGDQRVTWAPQPGSQEAFLSCPIFEALYEGTRGPGKLQPLDEPILTPMGWRPIGELRPGQWVSTPSGRPVRVTHIFPHTNKDTYLITFDDGSSTRVGDEHLWKFRVVGHGRKGGHGQWHINDTMELKRNLEEGRHVLIPTIEPVPLQRTPRLKEWPVDPYLLGLLLGDGCLTQDRVLFCTVDDQLAEYVLSMGFLEGPVDSRNGLRNFGFKKMNGDIRSIGLANANSGNKFIPKLYKQASVKDRVAVLQGLMDTDGTVDENGYIGYSSVSLQLARDVQYMAWSLGAKATLTTRPSYLNGERKQDSHCVYIQPAGKFEPFRLDRKKRRVRGYMHEELCRRVVSIEHVGKMDAVCIAIDDPSHLYITKDFIVTHNTDTLLMDFAQHVGQGYGDKWRGVLFRRTYPELQDVVDKSLSWFNKIFPAAKYNRSEHFWEWPTGEKLFLRHFKNEADYWSYHGHEYPWQGWEELTTWPDDNGYKKMFSCARSTHKGIPIKIRSTTNPYGVGHNWVKLRWRLPIPPGAIVGSVIRDSRDMEDNLEPPRVAVHGVLRENRILLVADPKYIDRIRAAARNKAELRAWIHGDWNIVAGGMFDDIWDPRIQVVPNLPFNRLPRAWRIDRSYDHGQSAPFAVGWWAESNGEPVEWEGRVLGPVPGDLIMIGEWYGWSGKPNEGLRMLSSSIARGIVDREEDWGLQGRVRPGPADTSIFDDFEPGKSVAGDMASEGVNWTKADKGPGSRKQGWEQIRKRLSQSCGQREKPGMFIMQRCPQFIRTVPVLPRSNKDLDDVNTESEDHIGDMVRYRLRSKNVEATGGDM